LSLLLLLLLLLKLLLLKLLLVIVLLDLPHSLKRTPAPNHAPAPSNSQERGAGFK